ncbi:MAG: YdeI/OmpD-associated family protein [Eubacteriales bacterium]
MEEIVIIKYERLVEIPLDFETELNRNESALRYWNTLSFSKKKKFTDLISGAKKADTCMERINKSIIMLSNNSCLDNLSETL